MVFFQEFRDSLAGTQQVVAADIGEEVVTADAECMGSGKTFAHSTDGEPLGAFNIHLQKINPRESEFGNDRVNCSCGHEEPSSTSHAVSGYSDES